MSDNFLNVSELAKVDIGRIEKLRETRLIKNFRISEYLPKDTKGWKLIGGGRDGDDGAAYVNRFFTMSLIISFAIEDDGKRWVHLSIASPKELPSWTRLTEAKEIFLGDRKAIVVLPKKQEYVNIHRFCLHVWCCLDGDSLPDFASGTGSI